MKLIRWAETFRWYPTGSICIHYGHLSSNATKANRVLAAVNVHHWLQWCTNAYFCRSSEKAFQTGFHTSYKILVKSKTYLVRSKNTTTKYKMIYIWYVIECRRMVGLLLTELIPSKSFNIISFEFHDYCSMSLRQTIMSPAKNKYGLKQQREELTWRERS